jgi:hypothetical protein
VTTAVAADANQPTLLVAGPAPDLAPLIHRLNAACHLNIPLFLAGPAPDLASFKNAGFDNLTSNQRQPQH